MNLECPHCGQRVNAEFKSRKVIESNDNSATISEQWQMENHANKLGFVCIAASALSGNPIVEIDKWSVEALKATSPKKTTLAEYLEAMGI